MKKKVDFIFYEGTYVDFLELNKSKFTHTINYISIASSIYKDEMVLNEENFSNTLINLHLFKRIKRILNYQGTTKRILYYINPNSNIDNIKENIKYLVEDIIRERGEEVQLKFKDYND